MDNKNNGKPKDTGVTLGNVLISGDDVLLHYELTKIILAYAKRNEIMSHKLIGLLEAVKHGLCTYTDMICVTGESGDKK
tara:strand:+ start:320 stop:556 length:237 start_codon:yes stop_codon:yes gene_type:complete